MENKFNLIKQGNLPNITLIIDQLNQRINRLEEQGSEYFQPDAEIIFNEEIQKTKELLKEIVDNQIQESSENDLIVENTHASLELEYYRSKKIIDQKMANFQLLGESDIVSYQKAVHMYNLFFNIIESLY